MTRIDFQTLKAANDGGEILILDPEVEHAERLLAGLRPPVQLVRLDGDGRGLERIAEELSGRQGVTTLHVVCHGEPGVLHLAGERIDLPALAMRPKVLAEIAASLGPTATVLLYGCAVADGVAGRLFVDYLEAALGVPVAASTGPVGAAARGGTWCLRRADGFVAPAVFSTRAREEWPGLLAAVNGTPGNDTLSGGVGPDTISAGAGDDVLLFASSEAAAGDVIDGGPGSDTIVLNAGESVDFSTCASITGIEAVSVAAGATAIFADVFSGQALAVSGAGQIIFAASASTSADYSNLDTTGMTGSILIYGDVLNDDPETIVGAANYATTINAGGNDDDVSGGSAADTISGSDGDDYLSGMAGDDVLEGNVGSDFLTGGDGNDMLRGGWDPDALFGGDGNDTLSGAEEDDYLCGEVGDDLLRGGIGDDQLCGASGNDVLSGGTGDDSLDGADGDDTLDGGGGADILSGGAGSDVFVGSDGATLVDWAAGETLQVASNTMTASSIARSGDTLAIDTDGDSAADMTLTATGLAGDAKFAVSLDGGTARITYSVPSSGGNGGGDGGSGGGGGGGGDTDPSPPDSIVVTDTQGATDTSRTISNTGLSSGSAAIVQNTNNNGNVVTATLPAGTTVLAEGPSTAQSGSEALATLIGAVEARNVTGEAGLVSGAQGFLSTLATTSTLDIRTIVPSTASSSLTEPIVIAGTTPTTTGGSQSEAFVLDLRSLPAGSTVQLDNIEFASIIGSATVTGGAGDNFAVGDDSAQFISLGEGDDTLYGGAGNDTVGSGGGADALFGDAGDDSVFGGVGADTACGGGDQDLVYGNQGDDALYGNTGFDTLYGGQDDDVAFGGQHEDVLYGNLGDDVLYGNMGGDTLFGGQGDDALYGGSNDGGVRDPAAGDVLYGNLGDDTLVGGQGDDLLYGGDGADLFLFGADAGDDTVADFDGAGGDRVGVAADTGIDTLSQLIAVIGTAADSSVQFDIAGNVFVLNGVTADELQSGWFTFV